MKYKYFNNKKCQLLHPIMTMGTFDGVHQGHRKLLRKLVIEAKKNHGEAVVITYYHHPLEIIHRKTFPYLLSESNIKENLLRNLGVDSVLYLNFDKRMAEMSAEDFLSEIIIGELKAKEIVVGYDTHFGKNREGNYSFLKKNQERFGYELHYVEPYKLDNKIISSSIIRDLVREGSMKKAQEYLGRTYSLTGSVVHGEHIGTEIGFPTINIAPFDDYKLIPALGVYITSLLIDGKKYYGVTNIGYSPTLKRSHIKEVETFIFDFNQDIYDKSIEIFFHRHIRDEKLFDSTEKLIKSIDNDILEAKDFFGMRV